jgi:hypothetical protein
MRSCKSVTGAASRCAAFQKCDLSERQLNFSLTVRENLFDVIIRGSEPCNAAAALQGQHKAAQCRRIMRGGSMWGASLPLTNSLIAQQLAYRAVSGRQMVRPRSATHDASMFGCSCSSCHADIRFSESISLTSARLPACRLTSRMSSLQGKRRPVSTVRVHRALAPHMTFCTSALTGTWCCTCYDCQKLYSMCTHRLRPSVERAAARSTAYAMAASAAPAAAAATAPPSPGAASAGANKMLPDCDRGMLLDAPMRVTAWLY